MVERLADLRARAEKGYLLDYYFLPRENRYRKGPGLTGDEILDDIKNGRFTADADIMKLRFDSGLQQHRVEIDALVRGSQPVVTSIDDEDRTDVCRAALVG